VVDGARSQFLTYEGDRPRVADVDVGSVQCSGAECSVAELTSRHRTRGPCILVALDLLESGDHLEVGTEASQRLDEGAQLL